MPRLAMPQKSCQGITYQGRDYDTSTGFIDVPDQHTADVLTRVAGCFPASNQPRGRTGWRCLECGFTTWFKKCGRCGGTCERETPGGDHATED